jgi:2-C-methyl-D-erythritol 4-phosphate cytidylyltransferase
MMDKVSVIIPAGGVGKRFGGDKPKQYLAIDGVPIIIRTLLCFERCERINNVVIAAHDDWIDHMWQIVKKYKIIKVKEIVSGGKERLNSIDNTLISEGIIDSDIVLVHDAVRPFVSEELINKVIVATEEFGAAIPGLHPKETIKSADRNNRVSSTLDRSMLWSIQTPQGFKYSVLKKAYRNAIENNYFGTDDSSLVEKLGHKVKIIPGEEQNIKITTPFDMTIASEILKSFK